jgi:cobalt/nickel transport system permease protein
VLKDKMVPLMGMMAAFIFAAQMLNFPVAGGTSGHLIGGVLAAVLLVIAIVLVVQCLIFQDGGLTALGANVVNMSLFGAVLGYYIYAGIRGGSKREGRILTGAAVAAWVSVVAASAACAVELALSDTSPLRVALPAMVGVHCLIGIGEAIITCLVIAFVLKVRKDLMYGMEEH